MEQTLSDSQAVSNIFLQNILILKQLETITKRLDKKIAYLSTEDAADMFYREHLSRIKKPANYYMLLDKFKADFSLQNIAEITADETEKFLMKYWGSMKQNTLAQRYIELKSFFNWCILQLKRNGQTTFYNPCEMFKIVKIPTKKPIFYPTDKIIQFINSANDDRQKAFFLVLITTGMRVGEVCALTKEDIDGQVITIQDPKSNRYDNPIHHTETAVMPYSVAILVNNLAPKSSGRLFSNTLSAFNMFKKRRYIMNARPHDFRKWILTWWSRQDDNDMYRFVSRHRSDKSTDPLHDTYVAGLTVEEVRGRMVKLENELNIRRV